MSLDMLMVRAGPWCATTSARSIRMDCLMVSSVILVLFSSGCVSLPQAILTENEGLVHMALLYNSPTTKDATGMPAILYACRVGDFRIVDLLVSAGADVNSRFMGGTPLHVAAGRGHKAIVQYLAEKGADVTATDREGNTALHEACLFGRGWRSVEVASVLLERGADITMANKNGKTPLELACCSGNREMVEFLLWKMKNTPNAGSSLCGSLHSVTRTGRVDIAQLLVEAGASVNCRNENGETPLHQAASAGDSLMVGYLLAQGAEVSAKNQDGQTALDFMDEPFGEEYLLSLSRPNCAPLAKSRAKEVRQILQEAFHHKGHSEKPARGNSD